MLQWINKLRESSKRLVKEQILQDLALSSDAQDFKTLVLYAHAPDYDYGVKQFKKAVVHDSTATVEEMYQVLDQLRTRQISGNKAKEVLNNLHQRLSSDNAQLLELVLAHNLKCGVGPETFNKILGPSVYVHPYRHCKQFNAANLEKIHFPAISQIKEDGAYNDVYVEADGIRVMSRNGLVCTHALPPRLNASVHRHAQGFVLMGEARVWNETRTAYLPREEGNGLLGSSEMDSSRLVYIFWDIVPIDEHAVGKVSLLTDIERFDQLVEVINNINQETPNDQIRIVGTRIVSSVEEVIAHFKEAVEHGEEGTVVKNFDGHWSHGDCADTVKIKIVFDCDLVIDDFEEGTGKNAGRLGAIVVRSVDNRLRVGVGIGFSDKQRTEIWAARDQYQNKVVTVKANDILSKGEVSSLFLPRFVEIRDDKQTGDTFDRVIEQRNSVFDIISRMKTI